MDCQEIKQIIPSYVKHAATEDQARQVEAHLCVCDGCRQHLANLMDNPPVESTPVLGQEIVTPKEKVVKKKEIGTFEYAIVGVAATMLLFFIYLFMQAAGK